MIIALLLQPIRIEYFFMHQVQKVHRTIPEYGFSIFRVTPELSFDIKTHGGL